MPPCSLGNIYWNKTVFQQLFELVNEYIVFEINTKRHDKQQLIQIRYNCIIYFQTKFVTSVDKNRENAVICIFRFQRVFAIVASPTIKKFAMCIFIQDIMIF